MAFASLALEGNSLVPRVPNPDPASFYPVVVQVSGGHRKKEWIRVEYLFPWKRDFVLASEASHRAFVIDEVQRLQHELKYSASWRCVQCGEHAHEILCSPMSWLPNPNPNLHISVNAVCGNGWKCVDAISKFNDKTGELTGVKHESLVTKRDGPSLHPRLSSCATCHDHRKKLLACTACKLIRYCGTDCQKKDWARHKKICKHIVSVDVEPSWTNYR